MRRCPVRPPGHRREFFCLDESTGFGMKNGKIEKGVDRQSAVRYEIRTNGILKVTEGPRYAFIEGDELDNFAEATRLYYERAARDIQSRPSDKLLGFA